LLSTALAGSVLAGSVVGATAPAEARSGRFIAGLAVGAIVGGLVASEVYRHKRKRYYAHSYGPRYYYGYAPRYRYYHW
jgi:hypothetical protein